MQAITTKFLTETKTIKARVKASAMAGYVFVPWNDALDYERNHAHAAQALATKLGWTGPWIGGGLPANGGMVWLSAADPRDTFSVTPKERAA